MNTPRKNCLILNFDDCSAKNFQLHFADLRIIKTVQILTRPNEFVFLNDSNQILLCRFCHKSKKEVLTQVKNAVKFGGKQEAESETDKMTKQSFDHLVVQMSLNLGADEQVRDLAVNSLGNVVLLLLENGTCRFLDLDILKQNYGRQQTSFMIDGTEGNLLISFLIKLQIKAASVKFISDSFF